MARVIKSFEGFHGKAVQGVGLGMNKLETPNFSIDKSNWTKVKLGDVAFESKETVKDLVTEGIEHVVGLEHIDSEDIHLRRSAGIEESTTFTKKFSKGDVLFGRRRAYLKKAAQANFDGICSGDITVIRAKKNLLPELLPFILNNDKFFDYAIKHSAGGLSPRVKFKDLANYEFLLPPKDQQEELAELLRAMDDLLESKRNLLEKMYAFRKSIQKKLFLGDRENNIKLERYCSLISGFAFPSEAFTNSGLPVVRIKNIVSGELFFEDGNNFVNPNDFKGIDKYKLTGGDIVIAMTGATLGKVGVVQNKYKGALLNQRVGKFSINKGIDKDFIYGICDSPYFLKELDKYIGEGAQGNISSDDILKCRVPLVQLTEINKYGEIFSMLLNIKMALLKSIKASEALKKSLSLKVF
ncbi:restriction endonuclease subunit S [Leptospira meyeri]|uniref:restriction endonuclease subunit S n=1 Tax=Leptospira meyeri TaxID=29508 RepID=UPI000F63A666|nr:restriction endonuclease subunit S [Leptospira meyeri]